MGSRTQTLEWLNARIDALEADKSELIAILVQVHEAMGNAEQAVSGEMYGPTSREYHHVMRVVHEQLELPDDECVCAISKKWDGDG